MGFWPFGSGKKKQAPETGHTREQSEYSNPSENMGRLEKASTDLSANTRSSKRLVKNRVASQDSQQRPSAAPTANQSEKAIYRQNPISQSSLGPENFSVLRQPPTLHATKPDHDSQVARRKSSKRKAEDYAREREIRAMSSSPIPIPRRPTSFYGGSFQRDVRDVPVGPSRRLNRPSSQVSLPIADALPNPDDAPYQTAYKIGMFAALSPRPTVKYDSRQSRGKATARPNPIDNPAIVEEDGVDLDKKRIDALADDLDSGGLRELMERDKRRRERKSKDDAAKLKRRLQRAEKQKEEEARKARTAEYVSQSRSRVKTIHPDSDVEIGEASVAVYQKQPKNPFADPEPEPRVSRSTIQNQWQQENHPKASYSTIQNPWHQDPDPKVSYSTIRNPWESEKDDKIMEDVTNRGEPAIPVRSPLRQIQAGSSVDAKASEALSPPVSPEPRVERQSISQASLLNRENADPADAVSLTGAASDHSSQRLNNWTAFFKRGTRRRLSSSFHDGNTPSEFSNTSRESFVAVRKQQAPPVITPRSFRRADSTPQRTMSKFREDLPEFPTPPDSRMQSPETQSRPGTYNRVVTESDQAAPQDTDLFTGSVTSPIPMPGRRERDAEGYEHGEKPEVILSQSLASVDSEASWLSGKPIHRRSGASQRIAANRSSLGRAMPGAFDAGSTLPSPEPEVDTSRGELRAVETLHKGAAHQPRLIRQASRAKSKEGLLTEYAQNRKVSEAETADTQETADDFDDDDVESPIQPEPEVTLMRAKSVDYKGHVRHISAGSARLLDIRRSFTPSEEVLSQPKRASTSQLDSHIV